MTLEVQFSILQLAIRFRVKQLAKSCYFLKMTLRIITFENDHSLQFFNRSFYSVYTFFFPYGNDNVK